MSKIVGYMVTWTTYGSWLRGDERGFVANGQVLAGSPEVLQADRKRQKSPSVRLNGRKIKLIRQVIFKEAGRIGHEIEALAVCTNHVHLLARSHSEFVEELVGRYKSLTTRVLWQYGRQGRIWTKGYDNRFSFSEEEFTARIKYVQNHRV
jgi:REP element-mobilizing transposase RayT